MHCCRIVNGIKNKKNSLGAMWNATHLAVRLCALRHWKRVSMPPTTQSLRHPLTRAHHIAPRIKTARLRRKTNLQKSDYPKTRIKRDPNALCVLEYDNLYLYQIINIQCIILIIGGREISRPYQNVGYRLEKFDAAFFTNKSFYHQGFFAVKRRAVFILGAMW